MEKKNGKKKKSQLHMTHENVKDDRERERLNVREKDVIEKARELEERGKKRGEKNSFQYGK